MDMKFIIRADMPWWYELFWLDNPVRIGITLHADFLEKMDVIDPGNAEISVIREQYGLGEFSANFERCFGFSGNLKFVEKGNRGKRFAINMPLRKRGGSCSTCDGTKRYLGKKCFFCGGSGKSIDLDFHAILEVAATLHLLFSLTAYSQIETKSDKPQLMMITTSILDRVSGFGPHAMISVALTKWLRSYGTGDIPSVTKAMKKTYSQMFRPVEKYDTDIGAYCNEGDLHLTCPGNACGLDGNSTYNREDEGYEMVPHNVDGPFQQLILIAGLAALHDYVRKNTT